MTCISPWFMECWTKIQDVCGWPRPVIRRPSCCEKISLQKPSATVVFRWACCPIAAFDALEYQVEKGDRLFLCSDGILECTNFAGEEFGQARLMKVLNEHRQSPLDTLLRSLQATMHQWAGSTEFADDVTLLALELGSFRN